MSDKKGDSFLTCMQACDTITLMAEMDFSSLVTNIGELADACVIILQTRLSDLPEDMVEPIARVQYAVADMLGIGVYESLNSGTRAEIFDV